MSQQLLNWFHEHGVLILAVLGVVEGALCAALLRMLKTARAALRAAQAAAEQAARAAALAAPGAIDPEAVLALLREGHAPTLDNVYAMMRRRESGDADSEPEPELVAAAAPTS